MAFWKRTVPEPAQDDSEADGQTMDEESLDSALRAAFDPLLMDRQKAEGVPAFGAATEMLSSIVAALPIRLYRRESEKVCEVEGDRRVRLLNGDTGDLLRGPEMWKAFTNDYLKDRGGFIFVNRIGNEVESLHYVDCRAVAPEVSAASHIFKQAMFNVDGVRYYPWQFIYACRNTRDGTSGSSLVSQASELLATSWAAIGYEQALMQRGGNRRGFLKSDSKLSEKALKSLRQAFRKMFAKDGENFVVLNKGIEFQEASETSVEMQMAENKEANASDVYAMALIPPALIKGGADEEDRDNHARYGLMPMLRVFEAAMNYALLLEEEKEDHFFAFDLRELTKANMKTRWAAWANAKKNGLVDAEEFRREENMQPMGVRYVNLGLNDVLLDPVEKKIIVPNMGQVIDLNHLEDYGKAIGAAAPLGEAEGGDEDGSEDQR